MTARATLLTAAFMSAGLFSLAPSGEACTCLNDGWAASQYLAVADAGFSGIVASIVPHPDAPSFSLIEIQVTGCWKGVAAATVLVSTSDDPGGCGYPHFVIGGHFLVFGGYTSEGPFITGICSGNRELAPDATTYGDLGPPGTPGDCEATPVQPVSWGRLKALHR